MSLDTSRPRSGAVGGRGGFRPDLRAFYARQYGVFLATHLAYRGQVAIWLGGTIVQPLVYIAVWRAVAGDGATGGYTADQFVAYYMAMLVVEFLTFIWFMWEFEWRVRTGAFSPLLLRPIHPVHRDICDVLSYKTVGIGAIVVAAAVLGLGFGADLGGVSLRSVLAFVPALLLAMALRFAVEYSLALSAFWFTRVSALNALYYALIALLGGQFAPLGVLQPWMQTLAHWTPFPSMLAFPVEVILGRQVGIDLVHGLAVQLFWLGLAVGAVRLTWGRAQRRYTAVGA